MVRISYRIQKHTASQVADSNIDVDAKCSIHGYCLNIHESSAAAQACVLVIRHEMQASA